MKVSPELIYIRKWDVHLFINMQTDQGLHSSHLYRLLRSFGSSTMIVRTHRSVGLSFDCNDRKQLRWKLVIVGSKLTSKKNALLCVKY